MGFQSVIPVPLYLAMTRASVSSPEYSTKTGSGVRTGASGAGVWAKSPEGCEPVEADDSPPPALGPFFFTSFQTPSSCGFL
jgi:hypothetical protein